MRGRKSRFSEAIPWLWKLFFESNSQCSKSGIVQSERHEEQAAWSTARAKRGVGSVVYCPSEARNRQRGLLSERSEEQAAWSSASCLRRPLPCTAGSSFVGFNLAIEILNFHWLILCWNSLSLQILCKNGKFEKEEENTWM